jgi:hypothetical protein
MMFSRSRAKSQLEVGRDKMTDLEGGEFQLLIDS